MPRIAARRSIAASCRRLVESSWFDPLMLGVIAINAVTLGLETYDSIDDAIGRELHTANDVILGVFVVELLVRLGAHGERPATFLRSGWNVFDFVVVSASFVPGIRENATVLRLVRLLRVVRAVRLLPDLRVLTVAVGRSIAAWPASRRSRCCSSTSTG
jgi:voltage-gated sodium channel